MTDDLFSKVYNPDVLSCLANLSNDEVFTPPEIVNQMLDMLPQDLFKSPDTTFLDPACKTGVFLREIAKRLIKGLEPLFPDLQERVDHIFHKQLFGIAITELTSLLSRRGIYCSKYPNSDFSVSKFDTAEGNIRFKRINHTWGKLSRDNNGKIKASCIYCGASTQQYERGDDLETHAYEFIHTDNPEKLLNMKFDVIISNPPYQLNVGSGGKGSGTAIPIYQHFIKQAKKLKPSYLVMITPSRWFAGGRGLDDFRQEMLNDTRIAKIVDFVDSKECFPGVDIAGGVSYFLWTNKFKEIDGCCEITNIKNGSSITVRRPLNEYPIFIRDNFAVEIVSKVLNSKETTMDKTVYPVSLFGLNTNIELKKYGDIQVRYSGGVAYCDKKEIRAGHNIVDKYKVYISAASYDHAGQPDKDGKRRILSIVDVLTPNTVCTSTYIVVKEFDTLDEAKNLVGYLKTYFVRFLLSQICISQHISRDTFAFVPLQDFSKPWTDEELYTKYNLTQEEIDFIESMIKPMG